MKLEITRTIPATDRYSGLTEARINGKTIVVMATGKAAEDALRRVGEKR